MLEKDFVYPIAFTRGMKYVDVVGEKQEISSNPKPQSIVIKSPSIQEVVINNNPKNPEVNRVEQARFLLEKLKIIRTCLASIEHIPASYVFSDKALERMAEVQPTTRWEMLQISGVGESQFSKYGEAFLSEIQDFKGIKTDEIDPEPMKELEAEPLVKTKISNNKRKDEFQMTREEAAQFTYQDMLSIVEIRDELNRITEQSNVKKTSAAVIWRFLLKHGYVEERNIKGEFVNIQTELGAQKGIKDVDTVSAKLFLKEAMTDR